MNAAWRGVPWMRHGRYGALVTDAGSGYSVCGDLALTRWTGDATREAEGFFLYVRDVESGTCWSAGRQPMPGTPSRYAAHRTGDSIVIERADGDIELITTIRLDTDAERRELLFTNHGRRPRTLEVTTYAEVVLNTTAADNAHPAFSKLFVETEYLPDVQALVARRRLRSPDDQSMALLHLLFGDTADEPAPSCETDRMRFIGRGRSLEKPRALDRDASLSGTTGNVLDPIVSLRRTIQLAPGATAKLTALLGAAETTEQVLAMASRYRRSAAVARPRHSAAPPSTTQEPPRSRSDLLFDNGVGGFTSDGTEYVIRLPADGEGRPIRPPLPWINVVANETIGFLASESGAGYTWSVNSRENRLTPWYNDPVIDPHGEALYIRDESTGSFWSPTPGPVPAPGRYETRHGFGYTVFRHENADVAHEVVQFVPRHDSAKITILRLTNRTGHSRRFSVHSYVEWVLGVLPGRGEGSVVAWRDEQSGAVFAKNPANGEFAHRVAFSTLVACSRGSTAHACQVCTDRRAFLGHLGSTERPAALEGEHRSGRETDAPPDPCAVLATTMPLAAGETAEFVAVLGQTSNENEARALARRYSDAATARQALEEVRHYWRDLLGGIRVETPSPAIDVMVNGWLAYQNLVCRMLARSAFYQSGGAFGFRDQLQDAAALLYLDPSLTRRQILLHAAHQFPEGDVLHWWHPPLSKGIRTHFSDDLLWLPYVTAFYVRSTGERAVLDERVPFVRARALDPGEDEAFVIPENAGVTSDLYTHCCLTLDRSLAVGAHGLPLMGTGDWNDGMNRVGREGRGESVWLGFFLFSILEDFVPLCERRGDNERVARYRDHQARLAAALNDAGWDGGWYRRAYYDDGTPLGSAQSDECRIDAIAQAWAVLSRAAPIDRAELALDALEHHLVDEHAGLIRLLTPAFDHTPHDPGYIKGYLPGVRENGGQYTHGALWAVRACAEAGRTERAAALLEMLSPIAHARDSRGVARYQVEPYVIAADVYGVEPHVGRGGWTWYTGSAGWMARVALESILGLTVREGEQLSLRPCIPSTWPGFTIAYRVPGEQTEYVIRAGRAAAGATESVARHDGARLTVLDGAVIIPIVRDGRRHEVEIDLAADVGPRYAPHSAAPRTSSAKVPTRGA